MTVEDRENVQENEEEPGVALEMADEDDLVVSNFPLQPPSSIEFPISGCFRGFRQKEGLQG